MNQSSTSQRVELVHQNLDNIFNSCFLHIIHITPPEYVFPNKFFKITIDQKMIICFHLNLIVCTHERIDIYTSNLKGSLSWNSIQLRKNSKIVQIMCKASFHQVYIFKDTCVVLIEEGYWVRNLLWSVVPSINSKDLEEGAFELLRLGIIYKGYCQLGLWVVIYGHVWAVVDLLASFRVQYVYFTWDLINTAGDHWV